MFHLGAFGCLFTWAEMGWAQNLGSLRSFYKDLKRMPSQAMAAVPVLVQSIHHDLIGRRKRANWRPVGTELHVRHVLSRRS